VLRQVCSLIMITSLSLNPLLGNLAYAKSLSQASDSSIVKEMEVVTKLYSKDKDDPYFLVFRKVPKKNIYDIRKCIQGVENFESCAQVGGKYFTAKQWNHLTERVIEDAESRIKMERVNAVVTTAATVIVIPIVASMVAPEAAIVGGAAVVMGMKATAVRKLLTMAAMAAVGAAGGLLSPYVANQYSPLSNRKEIQRVRRVMDDSFLECQGNTFILDESMADFAAQMERYLSTREMK